MCYVYVCITESPCYTSIKYIEKKIKPFTLTIKPHSLVPHPQACLCQPFQSLHPSLPCATGLLIYHIHNDNHCVISWIYFFSQCHDFTVSMWTPPGKPVILPLSFCVSSLWSPRDASRTHTPRSHPSLLSRFWSCRSGWGLHEDHKRTPHFSSKIRIPMASLHSLQYSLHCSGSAFFKKYIYPSFPMKP